MGIWRSLFLSLCLIVPFGAEALPCAQLIAKFSPHRLLSPSTFRPSYALSKNQWKQEWQNAEKNKDTVKGAYSLLHFLLLEGVEARDFWAIASLLRAWQENLSHTDPMGKPLTKSQKTWRSIAGGLSHLSWGLGPFLLRDLFRARPKIHQSRLQDFFTQLASESELNQEIEKSLEVSDSLFFKQVAQNLARRSISRTLHEKSLNRGIKNVVFSSLIGLSLVGWGIHPIGLAAEIRDRSTQATAKPMASADHLLIHLFNQVRVLDPDKKVVVVIDENFFGGSGQTLLEWREEDPEFMSATLNQLRELKPENLVFELAGSTREVDRILRSEAYDADLVILFAHGESPHPHQDIRFGDDYLVENLDQLTPGSIGKDGAVLALINCRFAMNPQDQHLPGSSYQILSAHLLGGRFQKSYGSPQTLFFKQQLHLDPQDPLDFVLIQGDHIVTRARKNFPLKQLSFDKALKEGSGWALVESFSQNAPQGPSTNNHLFFEVNHETDEVRLLRFD